jgi:4-hydroxy-tetrahydrodipicolinate reductase
MISLILLGAYGRMGKAVEEAAGTADDYVIKARIGRRPDSSGPAGPAEVYSERPSEAGAGPDGDRSSRELIRIASSGDVVVDFSSPEGTRAAALACAETGTALVTGTTGLPPDVEACLSAASSRVPVLRAANFSLGVLALRRALAAALAVVPGDWDIEIVERHHRAKADSPSGTALALAREAAGQRGLNESAFRHGREGRVGPRPAAEIGLHAVRGGTWVGDHAVLLAGAGEWLELRHVAQDRAAFARGALAAARFVARARPGLYALDHLSP